MRRKTRNLKIIGTIAVSLLAIGSSHAQSVEPEPDLIRQGPALIQTLDDLVDLSASQLDQLYRQSPPGPIPAGKVVGRALYPDARNPRARSNFARIAWQGKVFDPTSGTAVNRFFGVKAVKGNVYTAPSWLDGAPSMILDYEGTSRIYGNYRDEIRQVAPGLYLGLMYDRTTAPPKLKMYFAFEAKP